MFVVSLFGNDVVVDDVVVDDFIATSDSGNAAATCDAVAIVDAFIIVHSKVTVVHIASVIAVVAVDTIDTVDDSILEHANVVVLYVASVTTVEECIETRILVNATVSVTVLNTDKE